MPYAAPRPCLSPGCRVAAEFGSSYCAAHKRKPAPRPRDDRRASAQDRGYDARWQRFRLWFLAKHPVCAHCSRPATDVDHITPHSGPRDPLFWDQDNLQPLCHSCHSRKTAADVRAGLAGRISP